MGELKGHGVEVEVPPGWDGRIFRRPQFDEVTAAERSVAGPPAPPGAKTFPVVHLSNLPVPPETGDFGGGAVERLRARDAFVVLFEYEPQSATTPLFEHDGLPKALDPEEFSPNALERRMPRQAGVQRFFNHGGRAYCLYVVLGSYEDRNEIVPRVNAVLETVKIDPLPGFSPSAPGDTILGLVTTDPELSTLAALLPGTGVDETLRGFGPMTLLAPHDDAFAAFPDLDALAADTSRRTRLLMHHLVRERLPTAELQVGQQVTAVDGTPLVVDVPPGAPVTIDGAAIVRADIGASNGLVHVVDAVLEPPEIAEAPAVPATPEVPSP